MAEDHWKAPSSGAVTEHPAIESVEVILARATEVFGTREKAMRWLHSSIPSLGGRIPLELVNTLEGIAEVEDTLSAIEHGVW
jgi:putative toxin-antitoxin system antitoxin component (TIGR02293 family)